MKNLHVPERLPGESFASYRERRAMSHRAARAVIGAQLNGGVSSRQHFRDSMRRSGARGKRTRASDALMAAWASKRVPNWKGPRDEHGAYTLTGGTYSVEAAEGACVTPTSREHVFGGALGNGGHTDYTARRIWLAGISAQRGY